MAPPSVPVAPLLVFGWGNVSRGDDALGPLFVRTLRVRSHGASDVEFLEDYQLQIEHAFDLVGRQRVLFVDASLNCSAPFEAAPVVARRDASFSTHRMSPACLLQVFCEIRSEFPPPCTLLQIRGEQFELGEPPSSNAQGHLLKALEWAQGWLS